MKRISIFAVCAALIMPAFAPTPANAQSGDWFKSEDVNARLIAGSGNTAALQIDLADGWHTYWRVPGDSGLPPMLSWAKSENIEGVDMMWPAPKRKKEYEFNTFGYDGTVIFPLALNLKDAAKDTKLDLTAQIMICKDICIPQKFEVSLDIDKTADHSEQDKIITAAKSAVPSEEIDQTLLIDSIVAANDALVVAVTSQNGFDGMEIFPVIEEESVALTLPPVIEISEFDPNKAMIRVDNGSDFENIAGALQGKTLTVTLVHGDKSIVKSVQY